MTSVFYSAQIVEASARFERRIKIINRESGALFFRSFPPSGTMNLPQALQKRLVQVYTTPLAELRILWYDAKLELLFFEMIGRD